MTGTRGPFHKPQSARSRYRFGNDNVKVINLTVRRFPMPMEDFPESAQKVWLELEPWVSKQGLLDEATLPCFIDLCLTHAELRKIALILEKEGSTITTSKGVIKENPLFKVYIKLSEKALTLSKEFGLTPASRARLGLDLQIIGEDTDDPFAT